MSSTERSGPGSEQHQAASESQTSIVELAKLHQEDIKRIEKLKLSYDLGKAQIILVLLGEQPAVDIFLYPKDDSAKKIILILQRMGLVVRQGEQVNSKERKIAVLFIARTAEIADALLQTSPPQGARTEHEKYAQLMGFPQTAIDAFLGRIPLLPPDEQDSHRDPNIIFGMKLSKQYWESELQFLQKRSQLIKKYAPGLYKTIRRPRDTEQSI